MPHTNTWESDGLYRKFTGEISGAEILEANFALYDEPDFQKIKYVINDFTGIIDHSVETAHTEVYAKTDDLISDTKGELKVALIVNQGSHIALANNYRELMKDTLFECEIFQTGEDARNWVGAE